MGQDRRAETLLLGLAAVLALAAAAGARSVDPPGNDLLLHTRMVARAADVLLAQGWTAFQDPWFPDLNGGWPLFHHYPHLPHQAAALLSVLLGSEPGVATGLVNAFGVLLIPWGVWLGGRFLGMSPVAAAAAAFVAATVRCTDPFGHDPLAYGLLGRGLFAQAWGMALAAPAAGAWIAGASRDGMGLRRIRLPFRLLLAGALTSLVLRCSLPAGLLTIGISLVAASVGPVRELAARLLRWGVAAGLAVFLAWGFLGPFLVDLGATNSTTLELLDEYRRSVGAVGVLSALVRGEYLDGGFPGPWTLLLFGGLGLGGMAALGRDPTGERATPGLAAAALVSILLLFGRRTWGDWIDGLPLLGRFHDHRYLLGLHLVAPWLVGIAGVRALELLSVRRGRRVAAGVGALLLLSLTFAMRTELRDDRAGRVATMEAQQPFDLADAESLRLLEAGSLPTGGAASLVGGRPGLPSRLARAEEDRFEGGSTALSLLRRRGVHTFGRPLYHYAPIHDFALFWTQFVTENAAAGLHPLDVASAGVEALVSRAETQVRWLEGDGRHARLPGRSLNRLHALPDPLLAGPRLVRSDLRVRVEGSDLRGFPIAWFQSGLHRGRQHPTLDLGVGPAIDPAGYVRTIDAAAPDASALAGLPTAGEGELGRVPSVQRGPEDGDLHIRVIGVDAAAWLIVPRSWHPRWEVDVDGAAAPHAMLSPGWLGVPISPGEHEVTVRWRAAPWRGPWATANLALLLASFALVGIEAIRRP